MKKLITLKDIIEFCREKNIILGIVECKKIEKFINNLIDKQKPLL